MKNDDIGLWKHLFFLIINGLSQEEATEDERAQAVNIFWNLIGNNLTSEAR